MKIAVALDAWRANPSVESAWPVPEEGPNVYRFALAGRSDIVTANITDAGVNIEIFPERSGAHRALKDALGA